jgi:hypothetical protein
VRVRRGAWTPAWAPGRGACLPVNKTPDHAPPEAAWQVSTAISATAGQRLGYREAGSRLFAGRDRDFGDSWSRTAARHGVGLNALGRCRSARGARWVVKCTAREQSLR